MSMSKCCLVRSLAVLVTLGGIGVVAVAQDEDRPAGGGYGYLLDNVDFLLDNYTRFLVRRYDLDEDQETFTHELLQQRAHEFLDQRKPELRGLVDRLFEVRTGGEMDQQELIEWGKRVLPIYNEAKLLLVEGNAEWREVLSEEQRRIHDKDLKRMHESFQMTEDQLEQIAAGDMTVEEFRSPPRRNRPKSARRSQPGAVSKLPATVNRRDPVPPPGPQVLEGERPGEGGVAAAEPSRPPLVKQPSRSPAGSRAAPRAVTRASTPTRGRTSGRTPAGGPGRSGASKASSDKGFESKWEAYVREFVEKYKLDDEQTQRAYAILRDCQKKGQRYMRARKSALEKLDARLVVLKDYSGKDKGEQLSKITAQRSKLLEPMNDVFERQLKPRLERLPTSAQKQAAATAQTKKKPASPRKPSRAGRSDKGG